MNKYTPKNKHTKICTQCYKTFNTYYSHQNLCSFECRQEAVRESGRRLMRRRRHGKRTNPTHCQVCGFNETIDVHHEGTETYNLCPNHHALITRNIKTIKEVLALAKTNPLS